MWRVAVADPRVAGACLGTLSLRDGGIATSGRDRRRWGPGGRLHHLIDPETGLPAVGGPLAVTVVAEAAAVAVAHATALGVLPPEQAKAYRAARPRIGAVLVHDMGGPMLAGRLDFQAQRPTVRIGRINDMRRV